MALLVVLLVVFAEQEQQAAELAAERKYSVIKTALAENAAAAASAPAPSDTVPQTQTTEATFRELPNSISDHIPIYISLPEYAKYDNSFWLEEYVLIKNAESNLKYTPPAIDKIIKNAQDLENSFDIGKALGYINRKFRGVSSFEGSLYYKSVKLEVEENNEEGSAHFVDDIRSAIKKSKKVMY